MKIRSLALALVLSVALSAVAEAKKKPVYSAKAQKAMKGRKSTISKYKPGKRKVAKYKVKAVKHKA
jgi:cytochrome c556